MSSSPGSTPRPTALITGASSGIGRAIAVALANRGHCVAVGYRTDADGARRTIDLMGGAAQAVCVQLDLAEPEGVTAIVDEVAARFGGLDVLVNNAGVNRRAEAAAERLVEWRRILDIDVTGPFACSQAAARNMIQHGRGGRIINVTSVHEHIPISGGSAYCAAKAALGAVTKVMALELAPYGITVNAVAPGETATRMNGVPESVDAASISRPAIPVGRPGRSQEVASLVAYLATAEAAYITGASIIVDGGLALMAAIPNQSYAGTL
jgi:NAD(P)-dependent dehydrogenase (short-subunit alcohol dehydrogenase family)